jgi:histidinol-phosphate aminotransferase
MGIAIAQPSLIQILMNTKAPYNISTPSAALALSALTPAALCNMREKVATLISSRASLKSALMTLTPLGIGSTIGSEDANFLLIPILEKGNEQGQPDRLRAQKIYTVMAQEKGVVIRYRGNELGCDGCVRITIGSEEENQTLIEKLREGLDVL